MADQSSSSYKANALKLVVSQIIGSISLEEVKTAMMKEIKGNENKIETLFAQLESMLSRLRIQIVD
jgi:hypothetical protein